MNTYFTQLVIVLFPLLTFSDPELPVEHKKPGAETALTTSLVLGTVLDAATNKPIPNTHVYIVHGEEEDLTNDKGEFGIRVSGQFPLTLTAEHAGYKKLKITITGANQKQVVKLPPL